MYQKKIRMSSSQNILFRADSSSTIGTGHIMRDLVLASKYKHANIIFAVQDLDGNINYKIQEADCKIKIIKSNDIKEVNKLIKKYNINMIVIDHYGIDYRYEKKLKKENKDLKILSFDDTYEKHHCDILLNHNISGDKKRYKNLVPKNCEIRCGNKYTLIRQEFINTKEIKTILIAMGGADKENISLDILKVLKKFANIKIIIVTTIANPNIHILKEYINNKNNIRLYINSTKLAKLMKKSDLAIVSPSVIVHEVLYMGLSFIAIKIATNQDDMCTYLKRNKYSTLNSFNKKKLTKKINLLIGESNVI